MTILAKLTRQCVLALLLPLLLGACAAVRVPAPLPAIELLSDAAFGAPTETIGAANLFDLTPAMRDYLRSPSFTAHLRHKTPERGLVDALYKKGELKLEYDASMTRNAAETFAARSGNCLSLVIMTAAFARELNMTVRYQNVLVGESWSRNGGLYFASTHVNLQLGSRRADFGRSVDSTGGMLTIDFLPPADLKHYLTHPLEERDIVAMFMNNRAAEALAQKRLDDAYWWIRAALKEHPEFIMAYNTLGVIYQRHGDRELAERVFKAALAREPENTVIMHNLVPVLAELGKTDESKALARLLASIEPFPPFHYFNLGMKAMEKGDFKTAKEMFAKEVRRAPYNHEFHFALAVAHWNLGDGGRAREELRLAIDNSTTHDATRRYSSKLDQLRGLKPAPSGTY
jgi:Tfp pilus assembly protein PilF